MKWLLFNLILFTWNKSAQCQDIVFPDDEEISHVSGNNATITERIPVSVPDHCPKNMLLYPGDGKSSAWVCDCRPRFLYFPLNDSCHEAYKRGPCPSEHYVILPKGKVIPECVKNPCVDDGVVQYNNTCHPLRTTGGPCGTQGVLGVNEVTFELECIPVEVAPFIIIQTPQRNCPPGSRRNALGICRQPI